MGNLCLQNQQGVQVKYQYVTYCIKAEPDSTIKQLKRQIEKQTQIPTKDFVLLYKGKTISDTDTLETLGFSINYDALIMQKQEHDSSQITVNVKSLNFTEEIKISPSKTVEQLKQKIEEIKNLPHKKQRLIFSGVILKDTERLSSYGIKNGSTLHCTTILAA